MGFWSGGRERPTEQTVQGGVDGLRRHRVSGSAPEQPVPRKISDDDGGGCGDTDAALPPAGGGAGSTGSIDPWTLGRIVSQGKSFRMLAWFLAFCSRSPPVLGC